MRTLAATIAILFGSSVAALADLQGFDLNQIQKREINEKLAEQGVDLDRYRAASIGAIHSGAGASRLVFCGDVLDPESAAPVNTYGGFFQDGGVGAIQVSDAGDRESPAVLMCEMLREK